MLLQDVSNFKRMPEETRKWDAQKLVEMLKKIKEKYTDFRSDSIFIRCHECDSYGCSKGLRARYEIKISKEGNLENVLWIWGYQLNAWRARCVDRVKEWVSLILPAAPVLTSEDPCTPCHCRGEVIITDTTFKKNRYGRVVGYLSGVSECGRTETSASIILDSENTECLKSVQLAWVSFDLNHCYSLTPLGYFLRAGGSFGISRN